MLPAAVLSGVALLLCAIELVLHTGIWIIGAGSDAIWNARRHLG